MSTLKTTNIAHPSSASNNIVLDNSARVLVGTSTARANLFNSTVSSYFCVESTGSFVEASLVRNANNNNSSTIVLGKSRGTNANDATIVQSDDVVGSIAFQGADGTELVDCARITAVVDGTPGANDMPGRLVFSTTADGASSPTERMRINSQGTMVVYGSTSNSSVYNTIIYNSSSVDLFRIRNDGYFITGSATLSPYNLTTASAANVNIDANGGLQRVTSSLKYKKDVADATHGLAELLQLRSVTYKGKGENDGDTIFGGLIAEEVDEAGLREFVQYAPDGSPDSLAYGNMVSLCVKAIQEQQAMIAELQAEVAALKAN